MPVRIKRGKHSVVLSGPVFDGYEKEIRKALGPIPEYLEDQAKDLIATAKQDWPVRTGKSRDSLATVLQIEGEAKIGVSLYSPLEYVRYIKSTKIGKANDVINVRSPFQELVRKPSRKLEKDIKAEVPKLIIEHFLKD